MKTRKNIFFKTFLFITVVTILAPILILLVWAFAARWPWPNLRPEAYSLRGLKEILAPHSKVFLSLVSSISLSLTVAFLSAVVGTMTARALTFYDFPGKAFIEFISIAPNIVPALVFAMGIHVIFIKMSLADTRLGVIIVHLIYTLPYSTGIMRGLTESVGKDMEQQAYVLGASPVRAFFHVSLPVLMPGIMSSISMAYIISFSQYFTSLIIGGGQVKTFSNIMVPFIAKGDRTLGSAYALVFILSSLSVFILVEWLIKKLPYQRKEEL